MIYFPTFMAQYSLFVLKVPLNPKQNNMLSAELVSFVQDSKGDVTKSDKAQATDTVASKQNVLDIVSITSDGCEISFIMSSFTQ